MSGSSVMAMDGGLFIIVPGTAFDGSRIGLGLDPNITFNTDGTVTPLSGTSGSWGTPNQTGLGNFFWVRFHRTSGTGTYTGDAVDTWLALSASKQVQITAAGAGTVKTWNGTYEISSDSGGSVIVGSGNLSLSSDNT